METSQTQRKYIQDNGRHYWSDKNLDCQDFTSESSYPNYHCTVGECRCHQGYICLKQWLDGWYAMLDIDCTCAYICERWTEYWICLQLKSVNVSVFNCHGSLWHSDSHSFVLMHICTLLNGRGQCLKHSGTIMDITAFSWKYLLYSAFDWLTCHEHSLWLIRLKPFIPQGPPKNSTVQGGITNLLKVAPLHQSPR